MNVKLNGEIVEFSPNAVGWNNNTMVPFRQLFQAYGADVSWNPEDRTVTAVKGDITIKLTLGSFDAEVNGKAYKLTQTPFVAKDSVLVNLRFVSESLGAKVSYDKTTKTVSIDWEEKEDIEQ